MSKKFKYVFFTIIIFVIGKMSVSAASLSIWANATSVKVGQTVTISVNANSLIGSFDITTSNSAVLSGGASNAWLENNTYTYTFTAKSVGSATITVKTVNVSTSEGAGGAFSGSKSVTIKVVADSTGSSSSGGSSSGGTTANKKNYSSNNNLQSLEIEGYELSPTFSKDVKEYSVEVPNDIEKVVINATKEDSSASVSGTGEIAVSEGSNKIEIKVTAENGNENVYVINVTVKELDPIEVIIDNKKYTIIRKEGILEPPENYEKSSIKIGDEDVLCYKNVVTNNILIGLKDEEGNANYYSYDETNDSYTLYIGLKIGGVYLNILSMPKDKILAGYSKVSFEYEDIKLDGYQYIQKKVTTDEDSTVKGSDFYLIYAVNELTGQEGIYVYDKLENTVQRFDSSIIENYEKKADTYFLYLLIAIVVLAISIIIFSIILIKKGKHKTKFA